MALAFIYSFIFHRTVRFFLNFKQFNIKCDMLQYLNENPFGVAATFKFNFKSLH